MNSQKSEKEFAPYRASIKIFCPDSDDQAYAQSLQDFLLLSMDHSLVDIIDTHSSHILGEKIIKTHNDVSYTYFILVQAKDLSALSAFLSTNQPQTPFFLIIIGNPQRADTQKSIYEEIREKHQNKCILHTINTPARVSTILTTLQACLALSAQTLGLPPRILIGDFILDSLQAQLEPKQGAPIALTEKECRMLLILYQAKGKEITRGQLLADIWQYADTVETHTLETHIYRLRQKIEPDPTNPILLRTGKDGYYLDY